MGAAMRVLARLDRALSATLKTGAVVLGLAVACLMVLGVITRYVLGEPWFGLEEVTLLCVMWLYMVGASMACRERSHLQAGLMPLLLKSPLALSVVRSLTSLIALIMAIFIARWSFDLITWGLAKAQASPVFGIPWVVSQGSLFVGSVFFALYLSRDLVHDTREAMRARASALARGNGS
jgi:TRAP-type C4-dicarboxylate transport system permease small subunit